ncbi:MAG: hypothetical protein IJ088_11805 [Clostridia bacterium]|nr:hypothetical protein [Clostridia bacterium]
MNEDSTVTAKAFLCIVIYFVLALTLGRSIESEVFKSEQELTFGWFILGAIVLFAILLFIVYSLLEKGGSIGAPVIISVAGGILAGIVARLFLYVIAFSIVLFFLWLIGKVLGFFGTEKGEAVLWTALFMGAAKESREDEDDG